MVRLASDGPTDAGSNGSSGHRIGYAVLIPALAGCFTGCAREAPPPGSPPDAKPPTVVEVEPEIRSIVPGWSGTAKVRFDEPIVARQLATSVAGSPASRYDVNVGRSQVRIRPLSGAWLPGAVYHFTIPEGVADLLGNRTLTSIEIMFSTGPEFSGSLIEGTLFDRITGRPVASGRVIFLATSGDSVPYTALSGPDGRFRLPETPFGEYAAFAFVDRNASFDLERRFEAYDSLVFAIGEEAAAVDLEFHLTEPDSTPPILVSVNVADSMTLRLEFDDHLDPEQALDPDQVRVVLEGTNRTWPVDTVWLGEPLVGTPPPDSLAVADSLVVPDSLAALDSLVVPDSLAAAPDSLAVVPDSLAAADSLLAADSLAAADDPALPDSLAVPPDTSGAVAPEPLPSTVVTAELAEPLAEGEYRVTATGFRNLRTLVGGSDTTFVFPPPDSLNVGGDVP